MKRRRNVNQGKLQRRPFWLPASSFYFLVAGFSAASFFFVIGIMHDSAREPEIVIAGLVASGVLVSGVVLRELVLRNARERFVSEQKQLDANLNNAFIGIAEGPPRKLTLERNAAAIRNIKLKSEAAMIFESIAQGHREVFELCADYRKLIAYEIRNLHPDSPRLKALIHGNEFALRTHKFHILRWAELESRSLAGTAQQSGEVAVRIDYMERAKRPLEVALSHYPEEPTLKDSLDVIGELLLTVRMKEFISEAESAGERGDKRSALNAYHEALRYLDEQEPSQARAEFKGRIEQAIKYFEI